MIVDIIFIALIVLGYINGAKKGLVKSVWKLAAWVLTFFLVWILAEPFFEFISKTDIYISFSTMIGDKIMSSYAQDASSVPLFLTKAAISGAETAASVADGISSAVAKTATYIILIILIRVVLGLVLHILEAFSKLPVISFANKLAGGALGAVNTFLVIMIVLAIISVIGIADALALLQSSQIVKYLYNNNLLLSLFI